MSEENKWTTFTRKVFIDRPKSELYKAIGTPDGLTKWMLAKSKYTSAEGGERKPDEPYHTDDTFIWMWHNWDVENPGVVREANGTDFVAFTFDPAGYVEIKLEDHLNGTMVILSQKDIPTDDEAKMNYYYGCSLGWSFWLVNLKAYLEHGITLNETDPNVYDKSEGFIAVNN